MSELMIWTLHYAGRVVAPELFCLRIVSFVIEGEERRSLLYCMEPVLPA